MGLEYAVRSFEKSDTEAVRHICCETGLVGNPIDPVFDDRELFADLIVSYYLQREPEHALVGIVNDKIVGYLLGSVDSDAKSGINAAAFKALYKAKVRQGTGKYKNSPQNSRFLSWFVSNALKEMPKTPDNAAHLHINVLPGFRGKGIGTEMLKRFYAQAMEAGHNLVFEGVFAHPGKPEEYFLEHGFEVFNKRETGFFGNQLPGPVFSMCITRGLPYEFS